jgi:hypothetical protein
MESQEALLLLLLPRPPPPLLLLLLPLTAMLLLLVMMLLARLLLLEQPLSPNSPQQEIALMMTMVMAMQSKVPRHTHKPLVYMTLPPLLLPLQRGARST